MLRSCQKFERLRSEHRQANIWGVQPPPKVPKLSTQETEHLQKQCFGRSLVSAWSSYLEMWEHHPTPLSQPSVLTKAARHTRPAGKSLISLRAFNHCCDFIWSPSAKVGQEGHLAGLLWGQRKYEIMLRWKIGIIKSILYNKYSKWVNPISWVEQDQCAGGTERLQEAKIKCTQKRGAMKTIL